MPEFILPFLILGGAGVLCVLVIGALARRRRREREADEDYMALHWNNSDE